MKKTLIAQTNLIVIIIKLKPNSASLLTFYSKIIE